MRLEVAARRLSLTPTEGQGRLRKRETNKMLLRKMVQETEDEVVGGFPKSIHWGSPLGMAIKGMIECLDEKNC